MKRKTSTNCCFCFPDNLTLALERARAILRAKVDPSVSLAQGDLTAQLDMTVQDATSEKTLVVKQKYFRGLT